MTIDEIKAIAEIADIETRKAQIATEAAEADAEKLTSLNAELDELEKRAAEIEAAKEERKAAAAEVISGKGEIIATPKENKKMDLNEIRNSKEYIDAYAEYIKTGEDKECRALLSQNVTGGQLPVPALVENTVRTAWEKDDILSRVRKTYFKGNLKVAFELSATGAVEHTEGAAAPTEETLTLGIVTMIPKNIKKWISISDEAVALGGEAFLRYVYDELTYQIVKKLADLIVADIAALPQTATATSVAAAAVTAAPSLTVIPTAFANLSDQASNPVIIMNKLTYANFIAAQVAGNFSVDPFMNLPVLFNNSIKAYDAASAGNVYAIVGDLGGAQVNYPEGDGVVIKYDELSLAEKDLVKIVGRQYAAHAITRPDSFTIIKKPS